MTDLYIVQLFDDPYNAPAADAIFDSLEKAISYVQQSIKNDSLFEYSFAYIEIYSGSNGCLKPTNKRYDENGKPSRVGFGGNSLNEVLRLAGVKKVD